MAQVSGDRIYLNVGSAQFVNRCDRFEAFKVLSEIRDPETKEVIDLELARQGEIVAIEVRDRVSTSVMLSGTLPEVGDVVRKVIPAVLGAPASVDPGARHESGGQAARRLSQ